MAQSRGPVNSVAIEPVRGFTRWRCLMKLSYNQLVLKTSVYRTSVVDTEAGRSDPLLRTLWAMAKGIGLDVCVAHRIRAPIKGQLRVFLKYMGLTTIEVVKITGLSKRQIDYACRYDNITLSTLQQIIEPMGFQLAIVPKEEE